MNKYFLYLFFSFFFINYNQAQQLAVFDGVHDLYDLLNPAARDNNYLIYDNFGQESNFKSPRSFSVFSRNQWVGQNIEGSPNNIGFKGSIVNKNKFIVGFGLVRDKIGAFKEHNGYLKFAINLFGGQEEYGKTQDNISLNLGVGILGGLKGSANKNDLTVIQIFDPIYNSSGIFSQSTYSGTSVGIYGHFNIKNFKVIYGGGILMPIAKSSEKSIGLAHHQFSNIGLIWKESKKNTFEFSVREIWTKPFLNLSYFLRYHHSGEYRSISFASAGLGFRKNVFQLELFCFLNDERYRLGFIIDLFNPSFKSVSTTIPSIEFQFSIYL